MSVDASFNRPSSSANPRKARLRFLGTGIGRANHIRIPLIYLVVSATYIVLSTYLFGRLLGYSSAISNVEVLKGLCFVSFTTLVLWVAYYRQYRAGVLGQTTFRELVDNLADGVFLLGLPERRILYANPAAVQLFGYEPEELIGASTEMLHIDRSHFDEFDRSGTGDDSVLYSTYRMRTKSGRDFPTSHVVSKFDDRDGNHFALSVVRDESERARYEQQLRDSEQRMREIAENLREVFWISNSDKTRIFYVSPAYEQIWGRKPDELYRNPKSFLDAVHPEDRSWVTAKAVQQAHEEYDVQYRIERTDGEVRWIWDRAVPIRAPDGQVLRIVGVAEDITEMKQQEAKLRQAQKMEAVGQLTGGIAHDFNNLLTVILGNADLLGEALGSDVRYEEEVAAIVSASQRAASLTQRLLTFSRQQNLEITRVDARAVILDVTRLLERTLGEQISIESVLADDLWPVATDATQLETAVVNLAINARDAMPNGGRVVVTAANIAWSRLQNDEPDDLQPGDYVVIGVSDTGCGMNAEQIARAFEPFYTTKEPGKGTGLGLSTVYGFVKQSGGSVDIDSAPGGGSSFRMLLPRYTGGAADSAAAGSPVPSDGQETVLVVEDDDMVRSLATAHLKGLGYRVHEAGSGPEALELLEHTQQVALLFTDVIMPGGINGSQLAAAVRTRYPEIRILLTSGYGEHTLEQAQLPSETIMLRKPYSRQALAGAVRRAIDA